MRVNELGIPLSQYQGELARFRSAVGRDLTSDEKQQVQEALIVQALLAQAAISQGFTLDEKALQARLEQVIQQAGGIQVFQDWMKANSYDEPGFRRDLSIGAAAAWMRDKIATQVPQKVEQVHARQILTYNADQASQVYALLQAGEDFLALATQYDSVKQGDLGWFPRGYLTDPKLDEAVFNLEPGKYSPVIQTQTGFLILMVIERDPQRLLEPQARLGLQNLAVQDWLKEHRAQAIVEILQP